MNYLREEWKTIEEIGENYQISNLGNVRSLNYNKQGYTKNMKTVKNNDGYLQIQINCGGIRYSKRVHRLVAEAFIPNPYKLEEVNHIDLNRENNRIDNLEWCTHKENVEHSVKLGRYKGKFGEENPNYGNNTLKIKYENNKELSKEKQSRPKEKNGRAKKISMYDLNMCLIKEFPYMVNCFEYIISSECLKIKNPETLRDRVNNSIKNNVPLFNKYYFKK